MRFWDYRISFLGVRLLIWGFSVVIEALVANKVFGYLNFDIRFNNDISFLVGGNGSGKTTALKLVNALVNPNFKDLMQIPFQDVYLDVMQDGVGIRISAVRQDNDISLTVSTLDDEMVLSSHANDEIDYYSHRPDKLDDLVEEVNRKNANHPVVEEIAKIDSPVFLGLDRRRDSGLGVKEDYYLEREMWLREKNKRSVRARRLIKGSIGVSCRVPCD